MLTIVSHHIHTKNNSVSIFRDVHLMFSIPKSEWLLQHQVIKYAQKDKENVKHHFLLAYQSF